ncbi:MAG: hypothetical protein ACKO5A_04425 [Actinomycetota bacterium]
MSTTPSESDATVDAILHLGHGFAEDERNKVVELLDQINRHLIGRPSDEVTMEIHVKDRDHVDQRITLEGQVGGLPQIVASHAEDGAHDADAVWHGVIKVRQEFIRQLDDLKDERRPHHRH